MESETSCIILLSSSICTEGHRYKVVNTKYNTDTIATFNQFMKMFDLYEYMSIVVFTAYKCLLNCWLHMPHFQGSCS